MSDAKPDKDLPSEPKLVLGAPHPSPVNPVTLGLDDTIRFRCRKGIACFNECCRNIDITLTPYDIVRLKNHLALTSAEFVAQYTVPFEMDHHGLPGLKMMTRPGTPECVFLTEAGCGVYDDRPAACRYYALGAMGMRRKDESKVEDVYFLVKEDHCLGHNEPRTLTVREYRQKQGVEHYDEMNRAWRDLIIKKRSSGPAVGAPSARSMQLFDLCSYDLDNFKIFVQTPGFREVFDLPDQEIQDLIADEEALLAFSLRFLQQVLFAEHSIPRKEGARERRLEKRKEPLEQRRQQEIAVRNRDDPRYE